MPSTSREIFFVTRKLSALATLSVAIVAMAGCSIPSREPAVPRTDTTRALPLGIPNARFFADAGPQAMVRKVSAPSSARKQSCEPTGRQARGCAGLLPRGFRRR